MTNPTTYNPIRVLNYKWIEDANKTLVHIEEHTGSGTVRQSLVLADIDCSWAPPTGENSEYWHPGCTLLEAEELSLQAAQKYGEAHALVEEELEQIVPYGALLYDVLAPETLAEIPRELVYSYHLALAERKVESMRNADKSGALAVRFEPPGAARFSP